MEINRGLGLLIYYPFYPKFRWDFHRNALSRTNWASNSFAELSCRLSFTSQFREVLAEFRNEYFEQFAIQSFCISLIIFIFLFSLMNLFIYDLFYRQCCMILIDKPAPDWCHHFCGLLRKSTFLLKNTK